MLPPVFQLLKASTAVKAIVGSSPPRIYRHGSAPQRPDSVPFPEPYITWFLVSGTPENNLSDPPPTDRMSVQVDCWHQRDAGIEALAKAARDALEQGGHVLSILADGREPDTGLYRLSLQADLWVDRTHVGSDNINNGDDNTIDPGSDAVVLVDAGSPDDAMGDPGDAFIDTETGDVFSKV